jgi:hypothetical protein
VYNGHKHFHGLKYQVVMLLNRLFGHLFGLIEGHHNNAFMLAESGLMDECVVHVKLPGVGDDVDEDIGEVDTSTEHHNLQF